MKSNVKNFYVDRRLGLATLNLDHTLSLPSLNEVELKAKVDSKAKWTIVIYIAKFWIVSGDLDLCRDGQAIMAIISKKGDVRFKLKLKMTSNGYMREDGIIEFAGVYSLNQVYARGRRGIMLAIERDGCCHLISVAYGRMSKLQSIDSIVNVDVNKYKDHRIVTSVIYTGTKDEFIASGYRWSKRITLKLK